MKHFVLGTAGHVDHGKTALIKALTGVDTDRLKEEKKRGITIELGFASLTLPSGQTLGIVDVPGHEKFIKNMVSGAAGIDLVMMVIAADEGIMPQTKEHLHICSLLGISKGLVALTKIDMVEKDWLNLVQSEITEFLQGTFLEGAPIVPVSAIKGEGLTDLIGVIDNITGKLAEKTDDGIFRLPVDRVFTMKGFGTVVTGTLVSDHIKTGEEIQILPENITARIRGIHVHNQPVEEAWSGQRTAINLQGIEKSTLERGDVLVRPQTVWPSQRLDVFVEFLASNSKNIKNRSLVRLHTGTSEIIARIILLEKDELKPGEKEFAQLVLTDKDVVVAGDHFVLRSYSPITTIGGGRIIDPLPAKHKRLNSKIIEDLNLLQKGTLPEKISVILERTGFTGINLRCLAFRLGINVKKIREELEILFSGKKAFLLDSDDTTAISAHFFHQCEELIIKNITAYHKKNPLKEGISKEELKASSGNVISPKLFNMSINSLNKKGTIVSDKDSVRLTKHQVEFSGELDSLRRDIAGIYHEAGLTPLSLTEVMNKFKDQKTKAQSIIKLMLKEGDLIQINEELCFAREALEKLRNDYKAQLIRDGKATPASFKDLTGLSRKYIIPLMEYFDTNKLTVRVGDHRILREKT
ncbi:MAG: selenocysteine-specific translation elongation factor [Deltaproteobacteria bacterium HGW-Deltaproteobacteria-13]|jgi:selenocysteine-specific elongation factor|nr:MAG: selenocysteine-specific translation elongation factor [Deltaproteobacteria bacterium HGW-Deltaproteobacteria-13]